VVAENDRGGDEGKLKDYRRQQKGYVGGLEGECGDGQINRKRGLGRPFGIIRSKSTIVREHKAAAFL